MFGGLGGLMDVWKHLGRLRGELDRIGEELKRVVVEGSSGGGMVKVTMSGKQELLECKIDPKVFSEQDPELLEDLIVAAVNQGLEKSRTAATEQFNKAAGGLNIPGLQDALAQLSRGSGGS